jgi:hypothetical protein
MEGLILDTATVKFEVETFKSLGRQSGLIYAIDRTVKAERNARKIKHHSKLSFSDISLKKPPITGKELLPAL